MNEAEMRARLGELYLPPVGDFVLVDVPDMRYVMIDGHGAGDRSGLEHAKDWLFAVIHPLRRFAKARMGNSFVEPPLECLWWADDVQDFVRANRAKLNWRLMLVTAWPRQKSGWGSRLRAFGWNPMRRA